MSSINHTASLEKYDHYLLFNGTEHKLPQTVLIGVFLLVQLAVTG